MKPNELIHETSPYLLQHAYNPVQWYPWGEQALQKAKELNKPILVSIGYAACHWCHVMEHESFENEETAAYMNEHFINIKIDREERPDLDHIYMDAVQAISGSGGWPLNVFLTPDTKPFYGGTYFPPVKAFNRASWKDVLYSMNEYWTNRRDEVEAQATQLLQHLEKSNNVFFKSAIDTQQAGIFSVEKAKTIADNILSNADREEGGFGMPPKFLQTGSIQFLIQYAHISGATSYADHAVFTLKKMIRGGIYDQLAGGISRYSTDKEWLVPHFEKMLYDNALLVLSLSEAYAFNADPEFEAAIHSVIGFVQRELAHREGCFFTALDADSEGVEGKYYVWDKQEIVRLLESNASLFCDYYQVTDAGNWEHKNILHTRSSISEYCRERNLDVAATTATLAQSRKILLDHRQNRVPPALDDKILLNNNALFISALCRAYACTGEKNYLKAAEDACFFIEKFLKNTRGGLFHNVKNGRSGVPAFLDDYAYYIHSLIHLQEVTGKQAYLQLAREYLGFVLDHFSDEAGLLFYYSDQNQSDVIVRKTELYDGAMPSSNAVMATVLSKLSRYFDEPALGSRSAQMIANLSVAIEKYPGSFAYWASQYLGLVTGTAEMAVIGKNSLDKLPEILSVYAPFSIIQCNAGEDLSHFPLMNGKPVLEETLIYLCEHYSCRQPVKTRHELTDLLKNRGQFLKGSQ
jgi:uncharacterized protein YyaL (SSP411 family)